jgi:hypothetical protein
MINKHFYYVKLVLNINWLISSSIMLLQYLASRDFFQEKQSYLLTEFPLSKYERETTPFTLLSHKKEISDHAHLKRTGTDKVANQQ